VQVVIVGALKMQDWKMQDWKNDGLENDVMVLKT